MKKNKKVLSLLLALVMVFSTAVTAFATDAADPEGVIPEEPFKINATADRNNQTDGADILLKVEKAAAGTQNYTPVKEGEINVTDGTGELLVTLEANMDYIVRANDPEEVLPGSSYYYIFSTDADAKVKDELPKFHFDLNFKALPENAFTVYTLNAEGKAKGNVDFEVYAVELEGDDYKLGKDKAFIADLNTRLGSVLTTNEFGILGIDKSAIEAMIEEAEYKVKGTTVVAFAVNGEVVAFADLLHDDYVVLREVPENVKVEVTVLGYDGTDTLPAIEGATVEIQPNTTELWENETWGTAVDSKTTDVNGKVTFENVELSSTLTFLHFSGKMKNVTRINRVGVVKADGYQVPKYKMLTSDVRRANKGVVEITIQLIPEGYKYVSRIAGTNRYATSVEVAKATYTGDQKTVVLASGDVYADALVANGIVGMTNRPLVLTAKTSLSPEVEAYLKAVKAEEVLIIGGIGSVSAPVQAKLEAMGIRVARIAGSNRYDTSVKVLDAMIKLNSGLKIENVLLASGENFADALVASVPSAIKKQPILLTEAKALSAPVKAAFNNTDYGIENVIVVGGNSSVSDNAVAEIGLTAVERLSGQNRQLTSMIVANKFFTNGGQAVIADGTGFADALSAGQFASKNNAPILLTESKTTVGKDLTEYIKTNKMTQLTIVGGSGSVAKAIADQLETILAGK